MQKEAYELQPGGRLWWISRDGKKRGAVRIISCSPETEEFIYEYDNTLRKGRNADIGSRFYTVEPRWDHVKRCYTTEAEESQLPDTGTDHTARELWSAAQSTRKGLHLWNVETKQGYSVSYVNPDETKIVFGKLLNSEGKPQGYQVMLPGWNRHQWILYENRPDEMPASAEESPCPSESSKTDENVEKPEKPEKPVLEIGTVLWYRPEGSGMSQKVTVAALSRKKQELHFQLEDQFMSFSFSDIGRVLFLQEPEG